MNSLVEKELTCPICLELFTDVIQTNCCEQGYCRECLIKVLSTQISNGNCPSCRQVINLSACLPNIMIQRLINNLPVKCLNEKCNSILTRGIVEEHLKSCRFTLVDCPYSFECGQMEKQLLGIHLTTCPYRENPQCPIHSLSLSLLCEYDQELVCPKCALIGKHRHHHCIPQYHLQLALFQSKCLSIEANIPTIQSIDYWISKANQLLIEFQYGLESILNNERINLNETTRKEGEKIPTRDHQSDSFILCALAYIICQQEGLEITEANLISLCPPTISLDLIQLFIKFQKTFQQTDKIGSTSSSENVQNQQTNEKEQKEYYQQKFAKLFDFQGVKVTATPLTSLVKRGELNRMYVQFDIFSGLRDQIQFQERVPFSIAIVLDKSGSMSGSKLETCKQAIIKLIDRIQENDLLHLILYDSQATIQFKNGTCFEKEKLKEQVSSICSGDSTIISSGLKLAFTTLQNEDKNDIYRIKRVFLFSDGVSSDSKSQIFDVVTKMKDVEILTSSFGIGRDFDEATMKGVSDNGQGNYFYIENDQSIPSIMEKAMIGVERIVATETILSAFPSLKQNIIVHKFEDENIDARMGIRLGDLRERGLKQIILEMDFNAIDLPENETIVDLMDYQLEFKLQGIEKVSIFGKVTIELVDNWEIFSTLEFSKQVDVQMTIHEVSKLDKSCLNLVQKGKISEALRIKTLGNTLLERVKSKDNLGFVASLLLQGLQREKELKSTLMNSTRYSSSSYSAIAKSLHADCALEEDEDLGFGLFD